MTEQKTKVKRIATVLLAVAVFGIAEHRALAKPCLMGTDYTSVPNGTVTIGGYDSTNYFNYATAVPSGSKGATGTLVTQGGSANARATVHCGSSCNANGCLPRIRRSSAADAANESFTVACTSSETRLRYGIDLFTTLPKSNQCHLGESIYGPVNTEWETTPMVQPAMYHLNAVFGNPVGAIAKKAASTWMYGTLGDPGTGPGLPPGGPGGGCGALGC